MVKAKNLRILVKFSSINNGLHENWKPKFVLCYAFQIKAENETNLLLLTANAEKSKITVVNVSASKETVWLERQFCPPLKIVLADVGIVPGSDGWRQGPLGNSPSSWRLVMVPPLGNLHPALLVNWNVSHVMSLDLMFIKVNIGCLETKTDENSTPNILYYSDLIKHWFFSQNLTLMHSRLDKKVIWRFIISHIPLEGKWEAVSVKDPGVLGSNIYG